RAHGVRRGPVSRAPAVDGAGADPEYRVAGPTPPGAGRDVAGRADANDRGAAGRPRDPGLRRGDRNPRRRRLDDPPDRPAPGPRRPRRFPRRPDPRGAGRGTPRGRGARAAPRPLSHRPRPGDDRRARHLRRRADRRGGRGERLLRRAGRMAPGLPRGDRAPPAGRADRPHRRLGRRPPPRMVPPHARLARAARGPRGARVCGRRDDLQPPGPAGGAGRAADRGDPAPGRPRAGPDRRARDNRRCRGTSRRIVPGGHSMTAASYPLRLLLLALLASAALVASIAFGAAGIPLGNVIDALTGGADETTRAIVVRLRLPRAILAALLGGGLALSGAVFQALLRNPLAEPYILGVSGGAAVGAVVAIALGWSATAAWSLPAAAFVGAIVAILLVFRIATSVGRALDTRVLLLAGVILGSFFNAIVLLILTFSDAETFRSAVFWMMGSLSAASGATTAVLATYLLPAAAVLIALARPLNLLAMGEDTALYLGVRVETVKWVAFL